MKNTLNKILIATFFLIFGKAIQATPASKEYVDQEIRKLYSQGKVESLTHKIGESYQGGIIFFVDESKMHGLIVAMHDANNGIPLQWKNGETGEKVVNARANGLGGGFANTKIIISQQTVDNQEGNFAALAAQNYAVANDLNSPCTSASNSAMLCYGDWYLPSIYELDLMRINLAQTNILTSSLYWSSTESSVTEAWAEDLILGRQIIIDKAQMAQIRPIRSF